MLNNLLKQADDFINVVDKIEIENNAAIKSRERLMQSIEELIKDNEYNTEAYDIATHAIEILKQLSDTAVKDAYTFIEASINDALAKMFRGTPRSIRIKEYIRDDKYPQLEVELKVANGLVRSLKSDSGHGIAQIISILSILCLIVLTGARRILCIDEILSGLSAKNRQVITDILWSFTEIGFQFIIIEHGYIPRGAKVYELKSDNDIGRVVDSYIAEDGVYIQQGEHSSYDYKDVASKIGNDGENGENSDIISI